MINFKKFALTGDNSFDLYNALTYCKSNGEDSLVFDEGVYDFYADRAAETTVHVSNHDVYGEKRIAFLLKDMKNFTLDGGGSTFIMHDALIAFSCIGCQNVTLKNFKIDYDETMNLDALVTDVTEGYADLRAVNSDGFYIKDGKIRFTDRAGHDDAYHYMMRRSRGDNKAFIPEARDNYDKTVVFEDLGDRCFRIIEPRLALEPGMHILLRGGNRYSCSIFTVNSKDIYLEDVTVYRSYAMGLIAQKTENITITRMTVKAKDGDLFSLNCDATHFVHCKGLIKVTDSAFSEQQDDALNIHGIFTRIVDKTEEYIIVKYMHSQAQGLDIYEEGSTFAVLDPKTLLPSGQYTAERVEKINNEYTKIYVKEGTENIRVGDDVEDLTWSCDLLFERNRVVNNRARGMLISAKGRVDIKNNYFNTAGVAVLFESDGKYWFESGGTADVNIENNVFDDCHFVNEGWGKNVIEFKPREATEEGRYYHGKLRIADNKFVNNRVPLLSADNIETLILENNTVENCTAEVLASYKHIGSVVGEIK